MTDPVWDQAVNGTEYNENSTKFDYVMGEVVEGMQTYYTPVVTSVGSVGNCLSLYVFYSTNLHRVSTSNYLVALAMADTCFLGQLTVTWLDTVKVTHIFHRNCFCQFFVYVAYVCSNLSAWLVVAFTVERFVAVVYPLQRDLHCTMSRAKTVIIVLVVTSLVLNLPVLRFAKPKPFCNVDSEYWDYASKFNTLDTFVSFTIPFTLIVAFNVWIAIGVWHLERVRGMLVTSSTQSQFRVTKMLLIVSTVYVCLNMPAYVLRIVAYRNGTQFSDERWIKFQQISMFFFNTNFGINFALYCLTGQNFRNAVIQSFPWIRKFRRVLRCFRRRNIPMPPSPPLMPSIDIEMSDNSQTVTGLRINPAHLSLQSAQPPQPQPSTSWYVRDDEIELYPPSMRGMNSIDRPSTMSRDGTYKRWIFRNRNEPAVTNQPAPRPAARRRSQLNLKPNENIEMNIFATNIHNI